jgi:hypothetical protein
MLLMMQMHLLWFVDGGILDGSPNNVSNENNLWFMTVVDSSFIVCGISIKIAGLAHFGSFILYKLNLLFKRWNNNKKNA